MRAPHNRPNYLIPNSLLVQIPLSVDHLVEQDLDRLPDCSLLGVAQIDIFNLGLFHGSHAVGDADVQPPTGSDVSCSSMTRTVSLSSLSIGLAIIICNPAPISMAQ